MDELTDYNHERVACCLLIMAAAALLGREHPANAELQYIASTLAHPMLLVKEPPK